MSIRPSPVHGRHLLRALAPRPEVIAPLRLPLRRHDFLCAHQQLVLQTRGKKTKSSATLETLPQGLVPLEPLPIEAEVPAYPTVVLQALSNMRKFENCVLLTRVGGFYELYFEHAEEFGPLLNLKVAQKRTNAGFVSMAGFPFFQLDRYLKTLVQDFNRYVAIAEEFPNDPSAKVKAGGLMHDRKVSRVITPGTLIDENFMDPFTNNYVLNIHIEKLSEALAANPVVEHEAVNHNLVDEQSALPIGLAWLDLSTGHFFTQSTTLAVLPSLLARIGPREIVLDESFRAIHDHNLFSTLREDHHLVTYVEASEPKPMSEWSHMLESPVPVKQEGEFTTLEIAAGSTLLQYVETRLQGSAMKLQPPSRQLDVMGIDKNTLRALEIKTTIRDDLFTGSLLHTVRRTVTKGGARLLDSWLSSPSTSLGVINSRLDLVGYMLHDEPLRERLTLLLRRSHDSHRLLQKFAFGRGDPDDLLGLGATVYATQDLVATLAHDKQGDTSIKAMMARIDLDGPMMLANRIKEAVDEEGIVQQHEQEDMEAEEIQSLAHAVIESQGSKDDLNVLRRGERKKRPMSIRDHYSDSNETWIMKPRASNTLKTLHQTLATLGEEKEALGKDLSSRLNVASLTLRFTPGLGHICHVKGKDMKKDLTSVRSVSSSKSTRSFHHPEWTTLGQRIDQCRVHIRAEELRVLNNIREEVIANIVKLRRNAAVLDELDVACSFATLAAEKNWTRPVLNQTTAHKVVAGRHPTVEGGLEEEGRSFVSNDCFVGDVQRVWVITGPNMAGKSTFLRQNALITILAQVGSYVPAQYAELGVVDQIFSRVGSADNLYSDQSTFMVEMLETANILKNATSRSFVVMDEVGRGTTPQDGTAVAFASLHHLYHINKCRTLFATHFHDLADMVGEGGAMEKVGFYCTDVREDGVGGDGFRYVHRLREGINRQSHALKVARLAGLPEEAIAIAKYVLEKGVGSV